jgi:hypothetical protein
MKQRIICKTLAVAVILLFIGVGIQPAIAVNVSTSTFDNPPPNRPIIYGPVQGKVGVDYNFSFVIDDFEQRDFYFYIEWGDDTIEEWIGPYPAGLNVTVNHTWYEKGNYLIRCKAKDLWDYETDWSEFKFRIKRTRTSYHWLWERFPLLERLLGLLISN